MELKNTYLVLVLVILSFSKVLWGQVVSDGSDGPFEPSNSLTLNLPDNGIFNYTSITIKEGLTVRFRGNAANTPVFLAATGDVIINGTIIVSQSGVSNSGVLSGYPGGSSGNGDFGCVTGGCRTATNGLGPGGGNAGPNGNTRPGVSGGGGGNATPGLMATRYTSSALGGLAVDFPDPLRGGSGGGGGGGWSFFGVQLGGGNGGGGGGAMEISTPGNIMIGSTGSIIANGKHGGWAFSNIGGTGGPGAGGSGGNIDLFASRIVVVDEALLQTRGGLGGGKSTQPYSLDPPTYSNGAHGGYGYFRFNADIVTVALSTLDTGVIGIPGATEDNPILPIDPDTGPPWVLNPVVLGNRGMGINIPLWFDPVGAVGYDFEINGSNISSITVPTGIGDDFYDLLVYDSDIDFFVDSGLDLVGGKTFDVKSLNPNGLNHFRILGIELDSALDPDDPQAFPTGLTFMEGGESTVTMTPVLDEDVCIVDFNDFAQFSQQWGLSESGLIADLDSDQDVDLDDLRELAMAWMSYCPYQWPLGE